MRFVDTSILIYAVSTAAEDADKSRCALALLDERDLALSVQVLQEFYVQATRSSRPRALTHTEAANFARSLERFHVQDVTPDLMHAALAMRERYGLPYWHSAILAAAKECGCQTVLSEDLSAQQDYDGLRVVNPFA